MSTEAAIAEIATLLGARLSRSKSDLALHGASEAHWPPTPPDAVAYPEATEEVSRILAVCHAEGCPVIPWGTGTSLEGHALAPRGGVCVDVSRMDRVLAIRPEDMDCAVQPGITRRRLAEELRATGLTFPVDPGADASIGGMASTRASGTTAVRYGTMRDNVLGLEVVLADGRVIRTGGRARKSSAGYDLTGLFVGAEGTLGVITELTLRLHGVPEAVSAAVCAFPAMGPAVEAVIATIQSGVPMARIEFVDGETARVFNAATAAGWPEAPHLMVEFHGSEAAVREDAARFTGIAEEMGATDARWSALEEERRALWRMRHDAYWTILASRPGSTILPPREAVEEARARRRSWCGRRTSTRSACRSRAWPRRWRTPAPTSRPQACRARSWGMWATATSTRSCSWSGAAPRNSTQRGACRTAWSSARCGWAGQPRASTAWGWASCKHMEAEHGAAWDVMGAIKRALDPGGTMNPGKVVRGN